MPSSDDAKKAKSSIVHDIKTTFSTEAGQRVLKSMMKKYYWFGITFVKGDSHQSAFREGSRRVVGDIIVAMKLADNPEKLEELYNEVDA